MKQGFVVRRQGRVWHRMSRRTESTVTTACGALHLANEVEFGQPSAPACRRCWPAVHVGGCNDRCDGDSHWLADTPHAARLAAQRPTPAPTEES